MRLFTLTCRPGSLLLQFDGGDGGYSGGGFTEDPIDPGGGSTIGTNDGFDPTSGGVGMAPGSTDPSGGTDTSSPPIIDTGLGSTGGDVTGATSGTTPAGTDGTNDYLPPDEQNGATGIGSSSAGDSTSAGSLPADEYGYVNTGAAGPGASDTQYPELSSHTVADSTSYDSGGVQAVANTLNSLFGAFGSIFSATKSKGSGVTAGGTSIQLPGIFQKTPSTISSGDSKNGTGTVSGNLDAILAGLKKTATDTITKATGAVGLQPKKQASASTLFIVALLAGLYFIAKRR